jgi:hypothetical protein
VAFAKEFANGEGLGFHPHKLHKFLTQPTFTMVPRGTTPFANQMPRVET